MIMEKANEMSHIGFMSLAFLPIYVHFIRLRMTWKAVYVAEEISCRAIYFWFDS